MKKFLLQLDWWLLLPVFVLFGVSLTTLSSFGVEGVQDFFDRQLIWGLVSLFALCMSFLVDTSFLKTSRNIILLYLLGIGLLVFLMFFGLTANGARSWISFGSFTFQPADLMKLILIFTLAKYLARRHVEIRAVRHIIISGFYFLIPFILIFIQPDFGSALILLGIWFGMVLVSGISKKHLFVLLATGVSLFIVMWMFVFKDYQKARIKTFIDPLSDVRNTGYNVYQSMIAVGSGGLYGKGVGYGTQSRLSFLPEHETDFIFAALSEEWGFIGSSIVVILLFFIILRLLYHASKMNDNFDILFIVGVACYFATHAIINIGMNIGIMPVTGVTLPFVSYGGSHLLIEFIALGIVLGMVKRNRVVYRDVEYKEAFLM